MDQPEMTEAQELQQLIEHEIPDGRLNLENSYANLERVAAYCEANYLQAADKKAAFEETRRYTIQSLASVAYQINTLAFSLLQMIDMQHDKINDMVSQVNNIGQIVDIHKEKVARREIGVLTAAKLIARQHKIIAPVQQEKPQRYARREIDYTIFDEIGHGVKLAASHIPLNYSMNTLTGSSQQQQQYAAANMSLLRTGSTVSGSSASSSRTPQQQQQQQQISAKSSLSKSSGQRVMSINAPMPPAEMQQQHYGTVNRQSHQPQSHIYRIPQPPSTGHYGVPGGSQQQQQQQPMMYQHQQSYPPQQQQQHPNIQQQLSNPPLAAPPPQLASVDDYRLDTSMHSNDDALPPPPEELMGNYMQHSPPLPPPPMDQSDMQQPYAPYSTHRNSRQPLPDWVPRNYLEKVIAIYDYQAEKPDELSFSENAVIYVLRKNDDGWFEGISDGVTGLFPGNYIEPCL